MLKKEVDKKMTYKRRSNDLRWQIFLCMASFSALGAICFLFFLMLAPLIALMYW